MKKSQQLLYVVSTERERGGRGGGVKKESKERKKDQMYTDQTGMANSARPLAFATSNHFGRAQIAVALARMASSNF